MIHIIKFPYAILLLLCFSSCSQLPMETNLPVQQIQTGYGPEDIVIDTIVGQRILISCHSRRPNEPKESEIYALDIATDKVSKLPRIGEPQDINFNPHGLDLVKERDSLVLLVVSHDPQNRLNNIIRYLVKKDELVFLQKITSPLFCAPNAVTGLGDGSFIVSNDAGMHGNAMDILFKIKNAKAVFYKAGIATNADKGVAFGNGILINGNKVYRASTRQNKIFSYDFSNGKLINKKTIAKVKGPDNIRLDGSDLIVACHLKSFAFLAHMKDSTKHSPTTIYRIAADGKSKPQVIYFNDGKVIDACATGLIYRNNLYLSQVFDPQVVKVKLNPKPLKGL